MKQRQDKLLSILKESKGWIKGKDLAAMLKVTPRTIRNDMEALKTLLPEGAIESSNQYGYRINSGRLGSATLGTNSDVPQTPEERRDYLLKLLVSEKSVNAARLPSLLYVSAYTIEGDLRAIRSRLEEGGSLHLKHEGSRIWLDGDEIEKRRLYKELLSTEVEENFMNLDRINELYPEFDLGDVISVLSECLEQYGCSLRETGLPMLYMHIGIALQRLLHFHPVSSSEEDSQLHERDEYKAADLFYQKMSRRYQMQVPAGETEQLALLLMGRSYQAYAEDSVDILGKRYRISWLISQLLEEIRSDLGIDLEEDTDLIAGLEMHIRSLARRISENVSANNVYLEEIRWKFPLIFDMGVSAAHSLRKETGMNLDSNEIGFLALHFGTAYMLNHQDGRYKALVLFPHDYAMGRLVVDKISRQFSERMEIAACLNAFEEKKIRYYKPDLILSTLPVSHELPVPTVPISVFYSPEDESTIFQTLNELDRLKGRRLFISRIQQLIRPEFFYGNLEAENREEAIEKMCLNLKNAGYIPDGYKDSVLERESFAPTSFGNGFSLPHALNVDALHSCISIAFLKEPVMWGNYPVDFVLLLSIREDDRDLLSVFFDWWIKVVADSRRYQSLKCHRNYDDFMKVILED